MIALNKPPSGSAAVSRSRPFYAEHAALYDVLITDPVEPWASAVHGRLLAEKLAPGRLHGRHLPRSSQRPAHRS